MAEVIIPDISTDAYNDAKTVDALQDAKTKIQSQITQAEIDGNQTEIAQLQAELKDNQNERKQIYLGRNT